MAGRFTKSDYDGPWLFMAIAAASAGLVLTPLFRSEPKLAAEEAATRTGGVAHRTGGPDGEGSVEEA